MVGKSYPITLVKRAQDLHKSGWGFTDIGRIIAHETNGRHCPSRQTIRRWVDPDYAEAQRLKQRTGRPRKSRRKAWRFVFDRIQEMRDLSISYRAIAVLIAHDFDIEITDEQVERMCRGRMRESTMAKLLWPKGSEG